MILPNIIRKLLCKTGFHHWTVIGAVRPRYDAYCFYCGDLKEQS